MCAIKNNHLLTINNKVSDCILDLFDKKSHGSNHARFMLRYILIPNAKCFGVAIITVLFKTII